MNNDLFIYFLYEYFYFIFFFKSKQNQLNHNYHSTKSHNYTIASTYISSSLNCFIITNFIINTSFKLSSVCFLNPYISYFIIAFTSWNLRILILFYFFENIVSYLSINIKAGTCTFSLLFRNTINSFFIAKCYLY